MHSFLAQFHEHSLRSLSLKWPTDSLTKATLWERSVERGSPHLKSVAITTAGLQYQNN